MFLVLALVVQVNSSDVVEIPWRANNSSVRIRRTDVNEQPELNVEFPIDARFGEHCPLFEWAFSAGYDSVARKENTIVLRYRRQVHYSSPILSSGKPRVGFPELALLSVSERSLELVVLQLNTREVRVLPIAQESLDGLSLPLEAVTDIAVSAGGRFSMRLSAFFEKIIHVVELAHRKGIRVQFDCSGVIDSVLRRGGDDWRTPTHMRGK